MMNMFQTFSENGEFIPWMNQLLPFMWLLLPIAILDTALKAWGMWRAARMNKNIWFIALLLVNSLGILPAIFLFITKEEYDAVSRKAPSSPHVL